MKNSSKYFLSLIGICTTFLISTASASAAALPLPGVELFVKSISTGKVLFSSSDLDGYFKLEGMPDPAYNVFISNESLPPIKIATKNGVISGRIVILTDGTTTKEPEPVKVAVKKPVVKKPVALKPVVKVPVPTVVKPPVTGTVHEIDLTH